jgi:hypothetical protein
VFFPDLAHTPKSLGSSEKFKLAVMKSISPAAFLGSALGAGINQATDTPGGYGQGAEGYGKRFGSSMATTASTNLFGTFLLASIAHHDPRYFVQGNGSLGQSVKYGCQRAIITRADDGRKVFNWDGLLARLLASALANAYKPETERTVGKTFSRYGKSVAISTGVNTVKEFWPTITKKVLVPMHLGGP